MEMSEDDVDNSLYSLKIDEYSPSSRTTSFTLQNTDEGKIERQLLLRPSGVD